MGWTRPIHLVKATALSLGGRRMLPLESIYTMKLVRRGHATPRGLHATPRDVIARTHRNTAVIALAIPQSGFIPGR